MKVQMITPHLWFATEAEDAVKYYTQIFPDSNILYTSHYGKEGVEIHGMPEGSVMTVDFQLAGQNFSALNGGPHFKFNEAISFMVNCKDQAEIDFYWEQLGAGGDPRAQQCGWLKDKFGLSWQVVPADLGKWMQDKDRARFDRMMKVILRMKKLDLNKIREAYEGKVPA